MSGLSVLMAGGGSAGHVNPLLATADALRRLDPQVQVTVLGTTQGLEVTLVPAAGYPLVTIPKVPFPRRPNPAALRFPAAMASAVTATRRAVAQTGADVVVGFGGYVSTPAYLVARRSGLPVVVHEQNARPGLANRLGARLTPHVFTTFASTQLPHSTVVGLPMRRAITGLDRAATRQQAREHFGLRADLTTLLVFGGSLGAQRLNETFGSVASDLAAAGVQVLHLTGADKVVGASAGAAPYPDVPYVSRDYTDRMDLAYAAADLAVGRAGAGTVCELTAVGLPAVYVPLPVGNGEQRFNAQDVVAAGGGLLVDDAAVTPAWVRATVLPLLADRARLERMSLAAAGMGHRDADERLAAAILAVAG